MSFTDSGNSTGKVTKHYRYGVAGHNNSAVTNNIISEGHFSGFSGSGSAAAGTTTIGKQMRSYRKWMRWILQVQNMSQTQR